jgi:hypothetical protein
MEQSSSSSMVPKIVIGIVILVALYYLYNFLTNNSGLQGSVLLNSVSSGSPATAYTTTGDALPAIYEGGEFTINSWIYINDYSINRGQNKHLISFGGSTFLTCLVYLGPYKNTLSVRIQTSPASNRKVDSDKSTNSDVDLRITAVESLFGTIQTDSSLLDPNIPCDISSLEMQKWVQISIVLNNKTCDVYLDGKLTRSCILPSFYRLDKTNTKLTICDYNGFGGFVSNVSAYNYALNPEQVWNLYMTGPGPQYTLWQYITSIFSPSSAMSLDYPKKNITS